MYHRRTLLRLFYRKSFIGSFLISDRGLESIGVVDKIKKIIEAAGIRCTSYLDVKPNPTVDIVNEAAKSYKECGATSLVALGGGSPALCPNGGEIGCDFAPIPYKHSSFPNIPFGMPDFKLFCFQPLKSMLSLMKKDDSPFFRSESCNEAY